MTVMLGEETSSFSNNMKNTSVDLHEVKSSYNMAKL